MRMRASIGSDADGPPNPSFYLVGRLGMGLCDLARGDKRDREYCQFFS